MRFPSDARRWNSLKTCTIKSQFFEIISSPSLSSLEYFWRQIRVQTSPSWDFLLHQRLSKPANEFSFFLWPQFFIFPRLRNFTFLHKQSDLSRSFRKIKFVQRTWIRKATSDSTENVEPFIKLKYTEIAAQQIYFNLISHLKTLFIRLPSHLPSRAQYYFIIRSARYNLTPFP